MTSSNSRRGQRSAIDACEHSTFDLHAGGLHQQKYVDRPPSHVGIVVEDIVSVLRWLFDAGSVGTPAARQRPRPAVFVAVGPASIAASRRGQQWRDDDRRRKRCFVRRVVGAAGDAVMRAVARIAYTTFRISTLPRWIFFGRARG